MAASDGYKSRAMSTKQAFRRGEDSLADPLGPPPDSAEHLILTLTLGGHQGR